MSQRLKRSTAEKEEEVERRGDDTIRSGSIDRVRTYVDGQFESLVRETLRDAGDSIRTSARGGGSEVSRRNLPGTIFAASRTRAVVHHV